MTTWKVWYWCVWVGFVPYSLLNPPISSPCPPKVPTCQLPPAANRRHRWEPGVRARTVWLPGQRWRGPALQEGRDPCYPGQAGGPMVERQEQGGPRRHDPGALRGKAAAAVAHAATAAAGLAQLKQLRHPGAFAHPPACLRSAANALAAAGRHAGCRRQPTALLTERPRHGKGHPEEGAVCLRQDGPCSGGELWMVGWMDGWLDRWVDQ